MWQLKSTEGDKRTYVNSKTGSKCVTSKVYTDNQGNDWYGFDDLITIPYTRQFAATKVSSLYALGLTKDDLTGHINGLKTMLKSNDPERYEKSYALVLDFESKADNATEPIKQLTALVCVYYMMADEPIDAFENALQLKKLSILESDPVAHTFFLSQLMTVTEDYTQRLNNLSKIVLAPMPELPEVLQ